MNENKVAQLAISISSVLLVVILTHYMSYSQNSNNDKNSGNYLPSTSLSTARYGASAMSYQTFQDPLYCKKIQYPSNWEKIHFDKNFIVGFVSNARLDTEVLENPMIATSRLTSSDISLDSFGNTSISALESQYWDIHLEAS